MTTIGANILAQNVHDRARMYGWLAEAKPGLLVVCDEPDVAVRCKMAAPGALVAHRWIYEGDGNVDALSPQAWAARFLPALPDGIAGYALNEPSGDWRAISGWCSDVMRLAGAQHKPLIVANLAVGNPPESAIAAGEFDGLLLAFADWPIHRFGLHEYWQAAPTAEPFRVGRYKALKERARQIGAYGVRFAMTEAGRDVRGAATDGWQSVYSADEYAKKLTQQAAVYEADDIDMACFCYGEGGAGAWRSFDIQDSPPVLSAIVRYNTGVSEGTDDMAPPGYAQVKTGPKGVNVRSGPGLKYTPLAVAKTGDWAKRLPGGAITADGYVWAQIALDQTATTHIHGWCALSVIDLGE